jgi:hypothetical protein
MVIATPIDYYYRNLVYNSHMTTVHRFDYSSFQAVHTDEGFLVDTPVVARIGIQEYRRADGTIRREFRPPEEVFHADALASMRGKPITVDHPASGRVTSKSAHRDVVGTMLTEGKQDGDHVRTDITIHSPHAIGDRRELSLGYTAVLDETPGEWNGERYDAIQRNIRVNHLSVVKKGRAGVARLNLDSEEIEDFSTQQEQQPMNVIKVKLDSGLEYDAAPEVSVELNKLRADATDARTKLEAAQAKADTLQAKVDAQADEVKTAREQGRADALARLQLEGVASKFKIDHAGKTDRQVKEAVILAVRKDAALADKSDVYIDAAFDMAVEVAPEKAIAGQRQAVHTHNDADATPKTSRDAEKAYMDSLVNKETEK